MAKKTGIEPDNILDEHALSEEIDVEVKKILRSSLVATDVQVQELTEQEQEIFSESFLVSTVEQLIPSVKQEQVLMERFAQHRTLGQAATEKTRNKKTRVRKGSSGKKRASQRGKKGKKR